MKPQLPENRKPQWLKKSGSSFQQELVAAIHGAFEVTVDIIVREVETLVNQVTGDLCEELRRENDSLKHKLQKAEETLTTLHADLERNERLSNEVSMKKHRNEPLLSNSKSTVQAKVRDYPADHSGKVNFDLREDKKMIEKGTSEFKKMTGCDSDAGLTQQEQDGFEEITEGISRKNAVKLEARNAEELDLQDQDLAVPDLAESDSTLKQVSVKREEPEDEISATSCSLDFMKAVDFSLEGIKWIPELPDPDLDTQLINNRPDQALPPNLVAGLIPDHQSISSDLSERVQQVNPAVIQQQSQQVYGVQVRHDRTISTLYTCKFCNQTFNLPSLLRQHYGQCPQRLHQRCSQPLVENKRARLQIFPPGCSPFCCTVCNREFNRLENLKTHLRIHTGERPYTCSVCSKCFRHSGALTRHFRIHTGEKPYVCGQCGKSFRNCGGLKFHQRSHR